MEIIPAIDLIGGKCVRLTEGDFSQQTSYADDPLTVAQRLEAAGLRHLHLVDLDGARAGKVVNLPVLERIATHTNLHIDFGGGLRTDEDLTAVFSAGAQQITAGSIAVKQPETVLGWLQTHGPERIILGADVRNDRIAVSGWQEESQLGLHHFLADYARHGFQYTICTDVSKDGRLEGPSFELYREIQKQNPEYKVIASGGVTTLEDLHQLAADGLYGAIIGKALFEGRIRLEDLWAFL